MKKSVWMTATLLIVVGLTLVLEQGQGYLLIVYHQNHFKMHLSLLLLFIILISLSVYLILYALSAIAKWIKYLSQWPYRYHVEKIQRYLNEGLNALASGDWPLAEKRLSFLGEDTSSPQTYLHYLGAALAAQEQGEHHRCNDYLKKAQDHAKDAQAQRAVTIRKSYLLVQQGDCAKALHDLKIIYAKEPNNPLILKLLYQIYRELEDWGTLKSMLPALRKYHIVSEEILSQLENKL